MAEIQIRYDDGLAYERMMGTWSRAAGEIFLDWLAPSRRLRWIDVGRGSGAFTELLVERPLALERGYNNLRQQSALPTMSRALSVTSSDACLGLSEIIFTLDGDVARNSCRRRMMILSNESRMA